MRCVRALYGTLRRIYIRYLKKGDVMNELIYVADIEAGTRQAIQSFFEKEGFHVKCFESGNQLLSTFKREASDLIILGAAATDVEGFIISMKVRQISQSPIIMISEGNCDESYVFGISIGIDVYLTKPVNPAKLVAHAKAFFSL